MYAFVLSFLILLFLTGDAIHLPVSSLLRINHVHLYFYTFQNIRFSQALVRPLRFVAPQHPANLSDPYLLVDAEGASCMQIDTTNTMSNSAVLRSEYTLLLLFYRNPLYVYSRIFKEIMPCAGQSKSRKTQGSCTRNRPISALPARHTNCTELELPSPLVVNQTQSEDCLFLDTCVPASFNPNNPTFPSVVWVCGGAFIFGSKSQDLGGLYNSPLYNGTSTLAAANARLIYIAGSYRLGALGWLAGTLKC
jgi:carboxylesterase type B